MSTLTESPLDPADAIYDFTVLAGDPWNHVIRKGQTFRIDAELHRSQLRRLCRCKSQTSEVADQRLAERGDRCEGERHNKSKAMMPVISTTQDASRVHRCNTEADNHECRDPHLEELEPDRVIEHRRPRIDVGHLAIHEVEPARLVHPRVGGHDEEGRGHTRDGDGDARE